MCRAEGVEGWVSCKVMCSSAGSACWTCLPQVQLNSIVSFVPSSSELLPPFAFHFPFPSRFVPLSPKGPRPPLPCQYIPPSLPWSDNPFSSISTHAILSWPISLHHHIPSTGRPVTAFQFPNQNGPYQIPATQISHVLASFTHASAMLFVAHTSSFLWIRPPGYGDVPAPPT
jgi:hypothetical protein